MSVCICVFCGGGVYTMLLGQERGVWGWKCGPSVIGSEPNVTLCVSLCLCDAEEYKYSPLSVLTHTHAHTHSLCRPTNWVLRERSCVLNFVQVDCSWEDCKFLTKTLRKQLWDGFWCKFHMQSVFFTRAGCGLQLFLQQGVSSLLCRQRNGAAQVGKKNTEHRIWRKEPHACRSLPWRPARSTTQSERPRAQTHARPQPGNGWAPRGDALRAGPVRTQAVQNLHPASRQKLHPHALQLSGGDEEANRWCLWSQRSESLG